MWPGIVALGAALIWVGGCADMPPEPEDQGHGDAFDEEILDEHWDVAASTNGSFKNLQTVSQLVAGRGCSTAPSLGLSQQIAAEVACGSPGHFQNISDIPNVDLGPAAIPFLQKEAAEALRRAAARSPNEILKVNSTWRSVVQQYVLKAWEGSCGISVAARPGRSRHESGLALDIQFGMASALRAEGWSWTCDRTNGGRWRGCSDTPHWDFFNGADLRKESVKAFQRLWNKAHPEDRIAVDGAYGPQTGARINRAPLGGFAAGTTCQAPQQVPEPNDPEPQPQPEPEDVSDIAIEALSRDAVGESTGTSATLWRTRADLGACSTWSINEDYSSGRFNVHRYQVDLSAPGTTTLRFQNNRGGWAPAIIVVDSRGQLVYGGDADGGHPDLEARPVNSGRQGQIAELQVENTATARLFVYLTSWGRIDARLSGKITTSALYSFSLSQTCERGDGDTAYRGLDHNGLRIPRAGLSNGTLRSVHGVSVEQHGETVAHQGLSFVRGRVSWFGGPNDTGVTSTETGAITGERLRSLNSPTRPSNSTLASRPEDFYFIAMRWDYGPRGKNAWRDTRMVVVNPNNNKAIVVRAVDWGPHIRTGRVMDLSPQALRDLGLTTDENALIAFVDDNTPLGVQQ